MNKILNLIILVGVLAIVLVLALVGYNTLSNGQTPDNLETMAPLPSTGETDSTSQTQASSANPAPDFTVYDRDGNAYKLTDFRGKPVVLNFWASWCGPCKNEMPAFNEAYGEYGQEINFLMVNLTDGYQETVESASSFLEGTGYSFPVYFDTDQDAAMVYGVSSIPVTYFIDSEGNLVAQARGSLSEEILQKGISMILK